MPTEASIAAAIALIGDDVAPPAPAEAEGAAPPGESAATPPAKDGDAQAKPVDDAAAARRARLDAQLEGYKLKNAERKSRLASSDLDKRAKELAADRAAVDKGRSEVDAFQADPVKWLEANGRDPGDTFFKLAEAARKAGSPEAKIEALTAMNKAMVDRLDAFEKARQDEQKQAEEQANERAQATQREAAEGEFLKVAAGKTPAARLLYEASGQDPDKAMLRYVHEVADRQRARGAVPSYASIADEIETEGSKLLDQLLERVEPEALSKALEKRRGQSSAAEKSPGTQVPPVASRAVASRVATANGTLPNDLASSVGSNPSRRKSLAERQKAAEAKL